VRFNPFVSADERLLSQLDELIAGAGQVLATHKPSPPNMYGFATLDEQAFTEWRTQCLAFLTELYGHDHLYVETFRSTVQGGHRRSARVGRGMLTVVREDVAPAYLPRAATGDHLMIRVLHIDDEAPIRLLARVNLEYDGGWDVIEATDGRTGVQLAKHEQPDLILLNVNLPKLDGWEVAEELLKDQETREIPIVFLTARSAFRDRACGFDLGAVDYITKPFNPVELAPRLRALVARLERGERNELRRKMTWELRALIGTE
jgi:CheY-like chemotaxis protein